MSKDLSWRDAVLSGFRLVARRPVAALSWALLFVVSGTLMAGFQVWGWRAHDAGRGLSTVAVRLSFGGLALGVLATAVAVGAILRATIRPDDRHVGWPRFGGDELRLLAFVAPLTLLSMLVGTPFLLLVQQMRPDQALPSPSLAMWGSTIVLTLAGARLALAAPMTLAEGRLRLGGAFRLSRGFYARLASIFISALLLSIAIELAGSWVRDALTDALAAGHGPVLKASSLADAMASAFGASATVSRVFGALVHAVAFAVQIAPIGYAYRRLTGDREDPAAVFD